MVEKISQGLFGSFSPLPIPGQSDQPLALRYGLGLHSLGGFLGHNGEVKGYTDDIAYLPTNAVTVSLANIILGRR